MPAPARIDIIPLKSILTQSRGGAERHPPPSPRLRVSAAPRETICFRYFHCLIVSSSSSCTAQSSLSSLMVAASGMPCTFPLGEVSGVLMSVCASIQMRPIRWF